MITLRLVRLPSRCNSIISNDVFIICNYIYALHSIITDERRATTMAPSTARSSEATFNLRVDAALKAEFAAVVDAEDRPAAEVIRTLMRRYIEEARRRRFAAEARRQSQLVAASEDEAEVMRWIQDVSAVEGGK
jgi:antitoxin component of RelBE/YafQ-DinJ toxin-antitoxin module